MKKSIISAIIISGLCTGASLAQERLERIVVTGTRVDSGADAASSMPNIRMRVPADFVLFEATFVNSDLDLVRRKADLEKAFEEVRRADLARRDIEILIGNVEESAPLESTTFAEAYRSYGTRGAFEIALRIDAQEGESYGSVRNRTEEFLDDIEEFGRVQYYMEDEQYIGLRNPQRFRGELMTMISEEVTGLSQVFSASEITVTGLDKQTVTRPTGALSLDVYVPYTLTIVSKR
jgi:hypothetical protein